MNAWPTTRLDECCEIISGATPSTSVKSYWDGDIHWATPRDLADLDGPLIHETPRKITKAGLSACSANLLPPGSVLFSSRAPIGHVAINTVPMATNQGFKSFIPHANRMVSGYLYHWLRCNRAFLESLGNGATFKEVSKAVVARIEVPLPPIEEQRRIAAILDQADALRAKRRAALAQLDEMARAIFVEMFGDPSKTSDAFPAYRFGEVCEIRLGKMLDQKRQTGHHRKRYLRNASVRWFAFDLTDLLEMDFTPAEQATFSLRPGDILICEGGEPGRAAVWRGEIEDCYYQKALHRARVKPALAVPEFIVWTLYLLAVSGGLKDHVTVATIAHLTKEKLETLPVPIPPLELQKQFSRRIGELEAARASAHESARHLDSLFASLQHRAFRGEL